MRFAKRLVLMGVMVAMALSLSACREKGTAEKAGEAIDKAAQSAGQSADKAAKDVQKAVE